jgi:uncharacterized protein (TIGR02147 family)
MPEIFNFLDYREYLKATYDEKRQSDAFFSYRFIGNKVGMDSSFLLRVLQGKKHISADTIPRFCKLLKLNKPESEFFDTLVSFNKARTEEEARTFFDKLHKIRRVKYNQVDKDRSEYFSRWYFVALRNLLDFFKKDDFKSIGEQLEPSLKPTEVKKAVAVLNNLGLIQKEKEGYSVPDVHLHSGDRWDTPAIENFQKETLELALRSLQSHPKKHRDISTMTMNISAENLEEIRHLIREFQSSVARTVEETEESDRVYQLNIQFFPLSKIPGAS